VKGCGRLSKGQGIAPGAKWRHGVNDAVAALKLVRYYNPGPDYMKTQRYYLWALYEKEVIPALCRFADGDKQEPEITEFGEWEEVFFSVDPTLRDAWADYRTP
jgi:hypothetical protein